MIRIENLRVTKKEQTICWIDALQVAKGERVIIRGTNGSGKSTLLRVIAGLEKDFTGNCTLSVPVSDCCYVHQSPYMFRGTVLANATYGLRALGIRRATAETQAGSLLARLGMEQKLDRPAQALSGGELRRVAIARVLLLSPKVLLLDEPFAELDAMGSNLVSKELEAFAGTLLLASPNESPKLSKLRTVILG